MYDLQTTAKRIKELCDKHGISINKMLTESGAGARTYHNILAGSHPSTDKASKIADYLNCSVDYLLGRTNVPDVIIRDENGNFIAIVEAMAHNKPSTPTTFIKESEYRIAAHGGHVNEETQPSEPEYTSNLRKR